MRFRRFLLASTAALALMAGSPQSAQAAPVAAAIAGIGAFFGGVGAPLNLLAFTSVGAVGAAAGGITLAGIATKLLIGTALSAAGSFLAARAGQRTLSAGVNSNEVRLNTRQEIPPVRRPYGEVLVGGALFFEECKPPYLYRGVLLAEGPIEGLFGLQNSQTLIGIDYDTFEVLTPPYDGNLSISFRSGSKTQTIDPILDADFTNLASTFRQQEIATLVYKANYGDGDAATAWEHFQELWGQQGQPNILAKIRGVRVYDPRDPSQVVPPAREDYADDATYQTAYDAAQETWKWSNNATLCITDYLIYRNGCRVSPKRIDWEKTKESATWDDGLIGTNEGVNIRRHTIDGMVTAGQEPFTIIQSMLTANRGILVRSGGKMWIQTAPQKPVATLGDMFITGPISFRRSQPKKQLLNRLRCRFIDPRQDWQTVDGPIIDREDLREDDGNMYEGSAEFAFTADHRRAQRLAHCHIEDSRLGREITTVASLDWLAQAKPDDQPEPGRVIRFFSDVLPHANGLYRVMEMGLTGDFNGVELSLAEYDEDIERQWNPETDEQDFDLPDLDVS